MNVHDIPMVLFTLVSQMAVGTFLTLGAIQLLSARRDVDTRDRVIAPVLYAIGPVMVFGLLVSMLHMNDLTNTFNVIRHWDSSWLSREIIFGVGFAAFGFLFALLEWFGKGSHLLRQAVAAITALLGIGLLWSESMVYYSLVSVPAWHHWVVIFLFIGSAVLLGVLAVGSSLMITTLVRARTGATAVAAPAPLPDLTDAAPTPADSAPSAEDPTLVEAGGGLMAQIRSRVREINAPSTPAEWQLTARVLRWIAVVGATAAVAILVSYPIYLAGLGLGNATAQVALAVLSGSTLWLRLILLAATAVILGVFVYRMAETTKLGNARSLVYLVLLCLVLAFSSEFLGRLLHYAVGMRVGI